MEMTPQCRGSPVAGTSGRSRLPSLASPWIMPSRRCQPPLRRAAADAWASFDHFAENAEYTMDGEKEAARSARRTIFGEDDWKRHRSSARFLRHLSTISASGVIKGVFWHVVLLTGLALVVALWNHSFLEAWATWVPRPPNIAIEPIQLTSFALSMLLVFRTNASYARYIEGRGSFGRITTTCRDIARQAYAWFPPEAWDAKRKLTRWLLALAKSTCSHVRYEKDVEMRHAVMGTLDQDELEQLMSARHKPYFCVQAITNIIATAGLKRPETVMSMDDNCSLLVRSISACERLLNTPIPMSYTRHTARILMLWLMYMPFSLWGYCGWAMVPITALVSFVLLGIEEIGVYIEEPFSLLPLEALCAKLEFGLTNMMADHLLIARHSTETEAMRAIQL